VNSAADDILSAAIESGERWEKVGGALVVSGLVLEFLIALNNPPYRSALERWGPVVCDALVALGVLGEILFAARAGGFQSELTRRSNERLNDTQLDLMKAMERLAGC